MSIFKGFRPNLETITRLLLTSLKIRVTKTTADFCLQEHPGYPSLLALSDCLSEWKIDNQAYLIKRENYDADDLLFPFVAHLREDGGRFILVKSISDGKVNYADEYNKKWIISETEFLDRWDGIAQHAEKTSASGEQNYIHSYIQYILSTLIVPGLFTACLSILVYLVAINPFSIGYILLCSIKLIGMAVSILLLMQGIDAKNPFLKKLCGIAGKNDCNNVVQSDAAKLTPWLSWSEVGLFYFSGTMIFLLIYPSAIGILTIINILSLPYTIYSVTYQYRTGSWCILCCTVQILLWLEFFINLTNNNFNLDIEIRFLGILLASFLLPVLIWSFLKPFFIKSSQFTMLKNQLKDFKYNGELFRKALKSQTRYAVPDELLPIKLGNPDGKTIITLIGSPYCDPCGYAHKILTQWAEVNNDLQLRFIFKTGGKGNTDKILFAEHITALSLQYDKSYVAEAIEQWYGQGIKKYEQWNSRYKVKQDDRVKTAVEKQKHWCDLVEVVYTPTILVNGYKLPEPYSIEDIKYFTQLS